jgi:hypothetical protein
MSVTVHGNIPPEVFLARDDFIEGSTSILFGL